jgi:hypothetical protein
MSVLDDPYMIIVNSVISFFNLWVNFVTSFFFLILTPNLMFFPKIF